MEGGDPGFVRSTEAVCLLSNWLGQLLSPRSFPFREATGATSRVILCESLLPCLELFVDCQFRRL